MDRRRFLLTSLAVVLGRPQIATAQPKVARIGYLAADLKANPHFPEAFRQGLHDLGYVEGQNILIEYRSADGQLERLPTLAAELVRVKVDVLVSEGTPPSLAAKNATSTIPVVFAASADAVGSGLVASLARPGGNITGLSFLGPETVAKCLHLLKEAVPSISRAAVLSHPGNPSEPTRKIILKETEVAARTLALRLQFLEARGPDDFERVFSEMTRGHADGLTVLTSLMFFSERKRLVDLAAKHRLPAVFPWREPVDAGGFLAYGPNLPDLFRRAAGYVHRILQGKNPADLPVELPTKFDLAVNLKTAKALGFELTPTFLARADEVIE
jgi:putative tryptophan/tyrosine transport system substrate-binding protein